MQSPIEGSLYYAIRPSHGDKQGRHIIPSEAIQKFAALIPVYPEEITFTRLRAMTGLESNEIATLLSGVSRHYLLCEDHRCYSLLRRGLVYVD